MNDELKALLREFDSPQIVGCACKAVFGQCKHFAVPSMIRGAHKDGLIRPVDDSMQVLDSEKVYVLDLVLTDAGRVELGLPPIIRDAPAKKKKVENTLF